MGEESTEHNGRSEVLTNSTYLDPFVLPSSILPQLYFSVIITIFGGGNGADLQSHRLSAPLVVLSLQLDMSSTF